MRGYFKTVKLAEMLHTEYIRGEGVGLWCSLLSHHCGLDSCAVLSVIERQRRAYCKRQLRVEH